MPFDLQSNSSIDNEETNTRNKLLYNLLKTTLQIYLKVLGRPIKKYTLLYSKLPIKTPSLKNDIPK